MSDPIYECSVCSGGCVTYGQRPTQCPRELDCHDYEEKEKVMSDTDVPIQYKKLVDTMTLALADAGDVVWAVVGELGGDRFECDRFECYGQRVTVTVTKKGGE